MTVLVSKKSVKSSQPKISIITFNLQLTDGSTILNQEFICEYRQGDNIPDKVSDITAKMQAYIDNYKAEQQIFNSSQLTNAVTSIQGGLNV